jgi:hypothetical protein
LVFCSLDKDITKKNEQCILVTVDVENKSFFVDKSSVSIFKDALSEYNTKISGLQNKSPAANTILSFVIRIICSNPECEESLADSEFEFDPKVLETIRSTTSEMVLVEHCMVSLPDGLSLPLVLVQLVLLHLLPPHCSHLRVAWEKSATSTTVGAGAESSRASFASNMGHICASLSSSSRRRSSLASLSLAAIPPSVRHSSLACSAERLLPLLPNLQAVSFAHAPSPPCPDPPSARNIDIKDAASIWAATLLVHPSIKALSCALTGQTDQWLPVYLLTASTPLGWIIGYPFTFCYYFILF